MRWNLFLNKLCPNLLGDSYNKKFGYVGGGSSESQKVSNHLSACTCGECQSLLINRDRLSPAPTFGAAIAAASMPLLSSNPSAIAKLYLDFNGHTTSGTDWNTEFNNGASFTTPAYIAILNHL